MFGSDSFPLGPNGQFPRKRMSSYGVSIVPPVSMQDTYLSGNNTVSKLPVLEKDFHSSVLRVKGQMRLGVMMRGGRRMFRPRYAPVGLGQHEEDEYRMDEDIIFDTSGHKFDEGETDDSVGQWGGIRAAMESARARAMAERKVVPVMGRGHHNIRSAVERIGTKVIHPATGVSPRSAQAVVGSGGWLKGIGALLGLVQRSVPTPKPMPTGTAVMRGTVMRMSAGLFGDNGMGALPRTTSSGRTIATTWRYGKGTYYKTVRDSKGIVERGQFIGKGTSPIDYV